MAEKITRTGVCRYCGQSFMVEVMNENDEEELERMATMAYDCTEAVQAKELGLSKEQAIANVDALFAEEFPAITGLLKSGIELIVSGKADYILINTGHNVKARVGQTPNGKLKVERHEQQKRTLES